MSCHAECILQFVANVFLSIVLHYNACALYCIYTKVQKILSTSFLLVLKTENQTAVEVQHLSNSRFVLSIMNVCDVLITQNYSYLSL